MDIDKIVREIAGEIGKQATLGLWQFHPFDKMRDSGFLFRTTYEICKVIREDQRIKIFINITLIDNWETSQREARQIFADAVRTKLAAQLPDIQDVMDIVITDNG